ncbi:MAG: hypothetical protein IKP81_03330 [Paludibacteraceae bacterium]|nr:hypothetical protein [Paludibacteraceae bacterium]
MESLQFARREMSAIITLAKAMALADGELDKREVSMMLKEALRFGITPTDFMNLLQRTDSMELEETFAVVAAMNNAQKRYVTAYLGTMMAVDGNIDDAEIKLWNFVSLICKLPTMNIVDAIDYMQGSQEDEKQDNFVHNLLNGDNNPLEGSFVFHSNTHQRYENYCPVRGEQRCNRDVIIERNISGGIGYSITVKNPDISGGWGSTPMSTKPMKIISASDDEVELRGYGYDKFAYETIGAPMSDATFENYGMTIYHDGQEITHCVLHMIERNVDIDYYIK